MKGHSGKKTLHDAAACCPSRQEAAVQDRGKEKRPPAALPGTAARGGAAPAAGPGGAAASSPPAGWRSGGAAAARGSARLLPRLPSPQPPPGERPAARRAPSFPQEPPPPPPSWGPRASGELVSSALPSSRWHRPARSPPRAGRPLATPSPASLCPISSRRKLPGPPPLPCPAHPEVGCAPQPARPRRGRRGMWVCGRRAALSRSSSLSPRPLPPWAGAPGSFRRNQTELPVLSPGQPAAHLP